MRRSIITIIGATAALSLTACGSTTGSSSDDEPRGTNTSSSYTSEATEDEVDVDAYGDAADEAVDEAPAPDEPNTFGSTYTFDDGVSIHVSEPEPFTPTEWAAGGESHDQHVSFSVRVVNKSGAPFDASMIYASVASGAGEGDEVFDTDAGLDGPPETSVLDGREVTWKVGFGVDDPEDIVMQVEASWDHDPAIFTTE